MHVVKKCIFKLLKGSANYTCSDNRRYIFKFMMQILSGANQVEPMYSKVLHLDFLR